MFDRFTMEDRVVMVFAMQEAQELGHRGLGNDHLILGMLGNARSHTPDGTVVRTSVRRQGDRAVIEVADNGPGIPEETLPLVFERFTKADDARAHSSVPSTGLGLAIVRAIAEGFGGSAMVSSRPGRTAFTVTLPLASGPQGP